MLRFRAVQMLPLGDKLDLIVVRDACLQEHMNERIQVLGVNDQKLVLVKLYFHGPAGADHGNAGAAIVEQQVLKITAIALEDRQIDLLANEILVSAALALVAGL